MLVSCCRHQTVLVGSDLPDMAESCNVLQFSSLISKLLMGSVTIYWV